MSVLSLLLICDTKQERLDTAKQLVSDAWQQYPSVVQQPKQFIGYDSLLDAIKTGVIKVDLIVLTSPSGLHQPKLSQRQLLVYMFVPKNRWRPTG